MGGSGNRQYPRGSLSMYLNEEDPTQGTLKKYLGRAKRGIESVGHNAKERISDFYRNLPERYPLANRFGEYHVALAVLIAIGVQGGIKLGNAGGGPIDYRPAFVGFVVSELLNASVLGLEFAIDHFRNR